MGSDDLTKLGEPFEPEDDHECLVQLGMLRGGTPMRRFMERQVQSEKWRQRVVLKARSFFPNLLRNRVGVKQFEERLLGIESGSDKSPGGYRLSAGQRNTNGFPIAAENALDLDSCCDFSSVFLNVSNQCLRQAGGATATHLCEVPPGQQGRYGMTKSFEPKIDLAQPVKKQETGTNHIMFEFACHELQRR